MRAAWTTSDVAPREGFAYWREAVSQAYLPLEPENRARRFFTGSIDMGAGERLSVSRVRSLESIVHRTRGGIARRQDGTFFANLMISGDAIVHQRGQASGVRPGDVMLVDTNEPFALDFAEGVDIVCVAIRGDALRRVIGRHPGLPNAIPARRGIGRLVAGYISALSTDLDGLAPMEDLVEDQLSALMVRGLAFGLSADGAARSRAVLAQRIRQFITAEIGNPALGAKLLCARLGVSRSSMFEALAAEGLTLAGHIRGQRLRCAMAQLADPACRGLSILDIAERWGFRDPAAFSRTFKAATGVSPSAYRRRTVRDPA